MEDFNKKESRRALTEELEVQQNYLSLVPRPCAEDYQRLKEDIAHNGFDDASPIKVTEDMVVLDGHTRLQIARELGLEWVYVIVKDLPDHFAEKRYIIQTNLDQRHFTSKQKVEMLEKLLEINQAEARERQRLAGELVGKYNMKYVEKSQELEGDGNDHKLPQTFGEAYDKHRGEAMDQTARNYGISRETLRKGLKSREAARTDPEIARAWEDEKTTVNQVYCQVKEKEKEKEQRKKEEKPKSAYETIFNPVPPEKIKDWLHQVAPQKGVPVEVIDAVMEEDEILFACWDWVLQGLYDPILAWEATMLAVNRYYRRLRAALPAEVPLPDDAKKLGPWPLDYVHRAGLRDLLREFPAESAHLVYSDAVADLEQVSLLGEFAHRALTQGKYICVYVDKRHLPQAMARLSATGLTYFWTCSVFRPEDKEEVAELKVREKWRLLLIYRKGESSGASWDWIEDAVEARRPSNRDMARQLVKGLTMEGQLVVDPLVLSGVTGKVALSLGRRFLCFGSDEGDVQAANQRISQVRLAGESTI